MVGGDRGGGAGGGRELGGETALAPARPARRSPRLVPQPAVGGDWPGRRADRPRALAGDVLATLPLTSGRSWPSPPLPRHFPTLLLRFGDRSPRVLVSHRRGHWRFLEDRGASSGGSALDAENLVASHPVLPGLLWILQDLVGAVKAPGRIGTGILGSGLTTFHVGFK